MEKGVIQTIAKFNEIKKADPCLLQEQKIYSPLTIVDKLLDEENMQVVFTIAAFDNSFMPIKMSARKIVVDNTLINAFAPIDVKTIVEAALGKVTIIQSISFKKEKVLYKLANKVNGKMAMLTAQEIFHNKKLLLSLGKREASNIAYQAGLELNS